MNFQLIFQQYIDVLTKHKKELQDKVNINLEQFKEIQKTILIDKKNVSYSFNHFRIKIPKKIRPSHCIPRELKDFNITLHTKEEIIFKRNDEKVDDPFISLGTLNIILENEPYTSSWHLDRHTDTGIPTSFHPFYHLTFGGKHMESLDVEGEAKFGHSLIVRAPRISHPPMELILGIDYILQHYFVNSELDLLSDANYILIIKKLKTRFWMPYYLSQIKPFCANVTVDGNVINFEQKFVDNVNGFYSA